MKIVFDVNKPYLIPNACHPEIVKFVLQNHSGNYDVTESSVREHFGEPWHVYNSSFRNFYEDKIVNIKEVNPDDTWIYPVEIFGDFQKSFGINQKQGTLYEDWNFSQAIPPTTMTKLKQSNGYILITMVHEGLVVDSFFERLWQICMSNKLPMKKIIILTSGNHGIEKQYNTWHQKNIQTTDRFKVMNYHYFLYEKGHEYNMGIENFESEELKGKLGSVSLKDFQNSLGKSRDHKFLCFNRRMHPHRVMLIGELIKMGILDDNLVSFQFNLDGDFNFPKRTDTYIEEFKMIYDDEKTYRKEFERYIKKAVRLKKRMIDHEDLSNIHGFRGDIKKPWLNTYYSVVTESNFFRRSDYITEKTWKCVGNFHPFITFGRPNTMKELRNLGFKTFHPFIDESYDKVVDNKKRYNMILDEIKRLQNISKKEMIKWYSDMKDILLHNYNHFMKLGSKRNEQFKKLFDEIEEICTK
tara:strand:- start:1619 stop:3022 length:1404 start_codon:yes stop_codon:yes gene_type:complete